ncbi:MAG: hypothetical protein AVDCRST_MAG25-959, partial [uncultured Rubrobacteraceae bacterium]
QPHRQPRCPDRHVPRDHEERLPRRMEPPREPPEARLVPPRGGGGERRGTLLGPPRSV